MVRSHTGLRIAGGKADGWQVISRYFPLKRKGMVFVDLFAGSGIVSLSYHAHSCLMNDIDENIYSYFYVLGGAKFKDLIERYPDSERVGEWQYRAEIFDSFETEIESCACGPHWWDDYKGRDDLIGRAIQCLLMSSANFNGNYKAGDFLLGTPQRVRFAYYQEMVEYVREGDIRIWNLDFREVLRRAARWHPNLGYDYFLYADPPYLHQGVNLYRHSFLEQDTRDLRAGLDNLDFKWIVSEMDSPEIRDIFDGCYFEEVKWIDQDEVLISNLPLNEKRRGGANQFEW